ncbi:MAG: hypothetical protein EA424_06455 [Planctomycetaceae bacterium]|nr:MAG: hypothetical protein EA424_06455 [Planctomycetaceae bacterium]
MIRLCLKKGLTLSGHTVFPEFLACPPKGQPPFQTKLSKNASRRSITVTLAIITIAFAPV